MLASATLSLRASSPSAGATVEVHRAAAWNVSTVPWNTQPACTGTPATSPSPAAVGVQTWNMTALVSALYAGRDHGFLIKDSVENSGTSRYNLYDSMEVTTASYRPQLSVTWD